MTEQLSRRTALLAIGGATAVAAVPVAAIASNSSVNRSAWDQAFAAYERAKAEDAAYCTVYEALSDRCRLAEQAIPHVVLRPASPTGHQQPVTTADNAYVLRARRLVRDVKAGKIRLETVRYPSLAKEWQLSQEVAAAADERDAKVAAVRARFGMDQAEAKWEGLGQAVYEAKWALLDTPAPDAPTLLWKLEYLLQADVEDGVTSWSQKAIAVTMTDARRLLH